MRCACQDFKTIKQKKFLNVARNNNNRSIVALKTFSKTKILTTTKGKQHSNSERHTLPTKIDFTFCI